MSFFFFNDTATTEIYTLSLHDALPILLIRHGQEVGGGAIPYMIGTTAVISEWQELDDGRFVPTAKGVQRFRLKHRSEEHTSELQSRQYLVCRLLFSKKKKMD